MQDLRRKRINKFCAVLQDGLPHDMIPEVLVVRSTGPGKATFVWLAGGKLTVELLQEMKENIEELIVLKKSHGS